MLKKHIYKITPNSCFFYLCPIFFASPIVIAIKDDGYNIINVLLGILVLFISILSIILIKTTLPKIIVDYQEETIKFGNKNKLKKIPFKSIDFFEIVEKEINSKNRYLLEIWRSLYSDGSKVQHLELVYHNGKRVNITIRPDLSLINALKKKFKLKFETKMIKLRYYSYARVYAFCKLLVLILFFIAVLYL